MGQHSCVIKVVHRCQYPFLHRWWAAMFWLHSPWMCHSWLCQSHHLCHWWDVLIKWAVRHTLNASRWCSFTSFDHCNYYSSIICSFPFSFLLALSTPTRRWHNVSSWSGQAPGTTIWLWGAEYGENWPQLGGGSVPAEHWATVGPYCHQNSTKSYNRWEVYWNCHRGIATNNQVILILVCCTRQCD